MLKNWLSFPEIGQVLRRIRRDRVFRGRLLNRLRPGRNARISASWAHTEAPPTGWWEIPAVQARWNRMISGDAQTSYQQYVARKYLGAGRHLRGLSLGCGTGSKEVLWARTGLFASIDAFDLSEERIRAAQGSVRGTTEESVLHFQAANITALEFPARAYDMIVFDHSLHHMSPLEPLLQRITRTLTPEGLLVANEFIGPTRFQWSDRQLSGVNELLDTFPAGYRTLFESTFPRPKAIRPSKLAMWLSDPSEAVESSRIMPLLEKHFHVREVRGYGGTILHLLFSGIAHHFINPDDTGRRLMDACFAAEDRMLDSRQLDHDFALIICGNRDADAS